MGMVGCCRKMHGLGSGVWALKGEVSGFARNIEIMLWGWWWLRGGGLLL